MKIPSVESYSNRNKVNPNFGLKLSQNSAYHLINDFRSVDASDEQIIYYLKKIQESVSDEFTLNEINNKVTVHNEKNNEQAIIATDFDFSTDSGYFCGKGHPTYSYHYESSGDDSVDYLKETKTILFEHIMNVIKNAVKIKDYGCFEEINTAEYNNLIAKSQKKSYFKEKDNRWD